MPAATRPLRLIITAGTTIRRPADEAFAAGDRTALLRLMTWLSPAFPVGAFAFSHGLETAVAEGIVADGEAVHGWIRTLLAEGSGWNDLVLLGEAFRAMRAGDGARLAAARELGAALAGSRERRAETLALGDAFRRASEPWRGEATADGEPWPYPVAVGALAAAQGVDLGDGLAAFAHAFAANLVSVATRLVPLGQSEAARILHRLEPEVRAAAARAEAATLDDLGSAALASEIAALRHEALKSRLFRS